MVKSAYSQLLSSAADLLQNGAHNDTEASQAIDLVGSIWGAELPAGESRRNKAALLRTASRCADCFALELPYAPGLFAFGAQIDPSMFGAPGHLMAGANGCGVSFQKAFERCIGEVAEYASFLRQSTQVRISSQNPEQLPLQAELQWALGSMGIAKDTPLSSLEWICATSLTSSNKAEFPAEFVLRYPPSHAAKIEPAQSEGLGAGPTADMAKLSGLLEVIERDAFALWWYGHTPAHKLAPKWVTNSPLRNLVHASKRREDRPWWLLALNQSEGIPVMAALSSNAEGEAVAMGCSAGTDHLSAATSAYLEMCQMELAQTLSVDRSARLSQAELSETDRLWCERHRHLSISKYPRLAGDSQTHLASSKTMLLPDILKRMKDHGHNVYAIDLTLSDVSIPVWKILIPGFQSHKKNYVTDRLNSALRSSGLNQKNAFPNLSPI